jgi:hypothetical protein
MFEEKEKAEKKSDSDTGQFVNESEQKRKFRLKIITPGALIRIAALAIIILIFCAWSYFTMIKMPGKSYQGPLPILTQRQLSLKEELNQSVQQLASVIGERNIWHYKKLVEAADFIETSLYEAGYQVRRQNFDVEGQTCCNLEVEISGTDKPDEIIIIGAHYDTVFGSCGANDNGSGVAAALALARYFEPKKVGRTLRFVLFVNEEPPFFQTNSMGSLVYAKSCRKKNENVVAMLSLETIGYYTDEPKSQKYPFPFNLFYPSTGNFIGFVSNISSRRLLRKVIRAFRENCRFPSEGGAIPKNVPGISWSDHWAFWEQGYPAIMITDTAPFRYLYYHGPEDTLEKLDYERLARVVTGLESVIEQLVEAYDVNDR